MDKPGSTIVNCVFENIQNLEIIVVEYSTNKTIGFPIPDVVIKNINITDLSVNEESSVISLEPVNLYLEGPVIFNQSCLKDNKTSDLHSEILAITTNTYVQFSGYIEIPQCTATFAINANEIHIAEYSTINFTENTFSKVKSYRTYEDTTSMLASKMLRPCIFQYISSRENLDNEFLMANPPNYRILFNSNEIDFSPSKYSIVHCGWN